MYIDSDKERDIRRKNILRELNTFIISNMIYTKYLETFGNEKIVPFICDVQSLRVLYSSFMLMLWKDDIIVQNDNKQVFSPLSDELLDELVSYVAKKDNQSSWSIGNLSFEKNYDVINFIKNKLAHGDYFIEGCNVKLCLNKQEGYIPIDNLVKFTNYLGTNWESMQYNNENTQVFIRINLPNKKIKKKISNFHDVEEFINYIEYIEIVDKPKLGFVRDKNYKTILNSFSSDFKKSMNNSPSLVLNTIINSYSTQFDLYGIDIDIRSTPANLLTNIYKVKECFKKNKPFYKENDLSMQLKYLKYTIYEKNNVNAHKKNISDGIRINQKLLSTLSEDTNIPFKDMIGVKDKVSLADRHKLDKAILTSYLVGFYVVFIYGLDSIYTDDERDHIDKLFENKMFDFSKLDLSNIKYSKLVTSKNFLFFLDQFEKNKTKNELCMDKFYKNNKDYLSIIEKISEDSLNTEMNFNREALMKSLEQQRKILIKTSTEYNERKAKIAQEKKFLENNFTNYIENRSIIEHIRNSISHGNVKLDYVQNTGMRYDSTILFKDISKGQITFQAKLSTNEFTTLLTGKNLKTVFDYLDTNKKAYYEEMQSNDEADNSKTLKL